MAGDHTSPHVERLTARLRATITASHTEEQIRLLADALGRIGLHPPEV